MNKMIPRGLQHLFKKAANKDDAIRGYLKVAAAAASVSVMMLVLGLSVPWWIPSHVAPSFIALFLTAAVIFAAFAGMVLISVVLIKRNLF